MKDKNMFSGKRIVIYGTGKTGINFYKQYGEKAEIKYCTSSDEVVNSICGLTPIGLQELKKDKDFIVVCSLSYKEIRRHLILAGWYPGINFIDSKTYELLTLNNNKELVLAIGQCEIQLISECMMRDRIFSNRYSIVFFNERFIFEDENLYCYEEALEVFSYIEHINYLIIPANISPHGMSRYKSLLSRLNSNVKVIKVSLFEFDSYWPQDISKGRDISPFYLSRPGTKIGAYVERDREIEKLVINGEKPSEILLKVCDENYFDIDVVINNHEKTMKRIKLADKMSDIKIYDYVKKEYSRNKLFCDRGHFNDFLLKEYVQRTLRLFQSDIDIENLNSITFNVDNSTINEMPIYPSTAKILNLEWISDSTKYRMLGFNGLIYVDFKEYIERLIQYYYNVKNILDNC